MNTYLSSQWDAFSIDVWQNIPASEEELSSLMDGDFFIEVIRGIYEYEKIRIGALLKKSDESFDTKMKETAGLGALADRIKKDLAFREHAKQYLDPQILVDPALAHKFLWSFHSVRIPEEHLLGIVSNWYAVILEFDRNLARKYFKLVELFLTRRNLRYRVRLASDTLVFEYNPAVLSMECFLQLQSYYQQSERKDIYEDFDKDIRELFGDSTESKIRSVMRASSNLLECSAGICVGKEGLTAGAAISQLPNDFFPHESVKELLTMYYKFLSDYPGLRHSGNLDSKKRELQGKDAILFGSLSVLFSDYLLRK